MPTGVLAIGCFSFWKEFSCSSFHSFVLKWDPMGHCLQNSMMWMIFGATGKAFSSKLLIIMLQSNPWTLKAITCRWSTLLFKSKWIFCKRNSAEFLRMKTGVTTDVKAVKRQSVKDFCSDEASVSSRCSPGLFWKNWDHSYQIVSPVLIQVQFDNLKMAGLSLTPVDLLMNILRFLQLMSPS